MSAKQIFIDAIFLLSPSQIFVFLLISFCLFVFLVHPIITITYFTITYLITGVIYYYISTNFDVFVIFSNIVFVVQHVGESEMSFYNLRQIQLLYI